MIVLMLLFIFFNMAIYFIQPSIEVIDGYIFLLFYFILKFKWFNNQEN